MRTIRFYIQRDVTAFDLRSIGSKVLPGHIGSFYQFLEEALSKHDASKDHPGQHFVVLPKEAYHTVSAGDGLRTGRSEDYIVRNYREGPKMFLKREFAGDVNFLAVVVYTREAFLADPDITDEEREAIGDRSHAIVAVHCILWAQQPSQPLSLRTQPGRGQQCIQASTPRR